MNELLGNSKFFKSPIKDDKHKNIRDKFFKKIDIQEEIVDESPKSSSEQSGYSLSERGDIKGIYNDNPTKSHTTNKRPYHRLGTGELEKDPKFKNSDESKLRISNDLSLN